MPESPASPAVTDDQAAARTARLEASAAQCDRAAQELEAAVRHLQTAARHFRDGEIPRACAHLLAMYGHKRNAEAVFDELAVFHSAHSVP